MPCEDARQAAYEILLEISIERHSRSGQITTVIYIEGNERGTCFAGHDLEDEIHF